MSHADAAAMTAVAMIVVLSAMIVVLELRGPRP